MTTGSYQLVLCDLDERAPAPGDRRQLRSRGYNFRWICRRHKMIPQGYNARSKHRATGIKIQLQHTQRGSRCREDCRHRCRNDEKSTVDGEMEQIVDRVSFDRLVMCTEYLRPVYGWVCVVVLFPYVSKLQHVRRGEGKLPFQGEVLINSRGVAGSFPILCIRTDTS